LERLAEIIVTTLDSNPKNIDEDYSVFADGQYIAAGEQQKGTENWQLTLIKVLGK
jgi:hypothetical protein